MSSLASDILVNSALHFNSLDCRIFPFNSRKSSWSLAMMTMLNVKHFFPFITDQLELDQFTVPQTAPSLG